MAKKASAKTTHLTGLLDQCEYGLQLTVVSCSCMKMIMTNAPGPGEHHGCPFKFGDASSISVRGRPSEDAVLRLTHPQSNLTSMGVPSEFIPGVLELVANRHFQVRIPFLGALISTLAHAHTR
jgi:hypothetical protein